MGEAEVIITLRTFSGPNLGAEVMLLPGTYIIGTDYACDIVLSDSSIAPRHAALTAETPPPGQPPRVLVKPLDAGIVLEEEEIAAEGADIPPATPWFLGLTCLSWNTPNAPREEIMPRLPGLAARPVAAEEPEAPATHESAEPETTTGNDVVEDEPTPLPQKRHWPIRLVQALLLIAAVALVFEFRSSPDSTEDTIVKFRQEIRQAGLNNVVVGNKNDRITVSGFVLNEKERAQIWAMAQKLKHPAYIRISVREDMAQAVTMKFNSNGIFPKVTFQDGGEAMNLAAYIKDVPTEKAAFAALSKDLPNLPHIEKNIIHAAQLQPLIEQELEHVNLHDVSLVFSSGRIELTDSSLADTHDALQLAMTRVEENLNIPLTYTIISRDSPPPDNTGTDQAPTPLVPDGISPTMSATPSAKTPLEDVKITGVTMGAMRFIILDNGQRIFEGGMLPDGHVLNRINLDTLILSKNGQTTTYRLRGNNE